MRKKRVGALLLATVMTMGCLVGCGSNGTKESSVDGNVSESSSSKGSSEASSVEDEPITTDPITISILCDRYSLEASESDELWIFDYLENWMKEQGYDVTIEVTHALEPEQQLSMLLATNNLPDLILGSKVKLTETNAVIYGVEEGMLFDWRPYMTEEYMPNLMRLIEGNPDAYSAGICPDGGIYSLPHMKRRTYCGAAANYVTNSHLFVKTEWLEQCGLDKPTTFEGFIDMLRAFKNDIELEDDLEVIPAMFDASYLESAVWNALGYYGGFKHHYGAAMMIKDGEVYFPAATEDYTRFVDYMKIMYDEGLIHQDYLTLTSEAANAIVDEGRVGVTGNVIRLEDTFMEWEAVGPLKAEGVETVVGHADPTYDLGWLWGSSEMEHPEVVVKMLDYLYSPEGSVMYNYGPMEGTMDETDPLNTVEGWYYNEKGEITNKAVEDGSIDLMINYTSKYIYPTSMFNSVDYIPESQKMYGLDDVVEVAQWTDAITGTVVDIQWSKRYTHDDPNGHSRLTIVDAWKDNTTFVKLPAVYLTEEQSNRANDIKLLLEEHILTETPKFITGKRPVSEIADFQEELKQLGVEEFVEIYREAYSNYMEETFK